MLGIACLMGVHLGALQVLAQRATASVIGSVSQATGGVCRRASSVVAPRFAHVAATDSRRLERGLS